mgnify:CR=1 FL=1
MERLLESSFDSGPLENAVFVARHTVAVGYRRPVDGRLSHAAKIDNGAGRSRIRAANRRFDYEENDWRHSVAATQGSALADDLFRFGASSLLGDIERQLGHNGNLSLFVSDVTDQFKKIAQLTLKTSITFECVKI